MIARRILIISVMIALTGGLSADISAYQPLGSPASITSQGEVPSLGPKALLDDFNSGTILNAWNGVTGAFAKEGTTASCTATYVDDAGIVYGGTGRSLKIEYNVNHVGSYAGYSSSMLGESLVSPIKYTALSFYVKGASGTKPELFKIELKNKSTTQGTYTTWDKRIVKYYRNAASVYITDYLDGGVTTSWQKVTIPLHNFANLDGFSGMSELVIVFENSQSAANGSDTQGAIYIDNIMFENIDIPAVRIDHFGDKVGTCALGGNIGTGTGGTAPSAGNDHSFSDGTGADYYTNDFYPVKNGLKINYNVTPLASSAYTFIMFGGGNGAKEKDGQGQYTVDSPENGWIAIPHDFSEYNYLYLVVRGAPGGNPKQIKVELKQGDGTVKAVRVGHPGDVNAVPVRSPDLIDTSFKSWQIPLGAGTTQDPGFNVDKSSIKQITFTLEGSQIRLKGTNPIDGNDTGTVYIDYVQFTKEKYI
ncbi:MAG: hypothetical protein NTY34_00265 [Candidatus Omnitrophica bacterium]|nr:hypothetical protein [Candidatus Omnitrophota bacterium]